MLHALLKNCYILLVETTFLQFKIDFVPRESIGDSIIRLFNSILLRESLREIIIQLLQLVVGIGIRRTFVCIDLST